VASVIQGHLDTYRFCDEVWTFLIKNVTFKMENSVTVQADKVKIVSCNSRRPGDPQYMQTSTIDEVLGVSRKRDGSRFAVRASQE
jgi:hypothetical protein